MMTNKPSVSRVLQSICAMSVQEQLELLMQIIAVVRESLPATPPHSILELEGLGAHIWRGADAQAYVNQERVTWNR